MCTEPSPGHLPARRTRGTSGPGHFSSTLFIAPLFVVLLVLALSGCSLRPLVQLPARTSVVVTPDPALEAQCRKLDHVVIGLTAGSVAAAALGGSTGLSALLTSDTSRWATGGVAVGTTVTSAVLTYLSNAYSQQYTRTCTAATTGGDP